MAIYSDRRLVPLEENATAYREIRFYGKEQHLVIKCSSRQEIGEFETFKASLQDAFLSHSYNEFAFEDFQHGYLKLTKNDEFFINDQLKEYNSNNAISYTELNIGSGRDVEID
ncbi:hypothetical protein CHL76_16530 [Marinococcus halophilus]|uniref:hypothetical protein n=1 Tax=Marinococcus halophilus TaxID=1371 RepID=UPI000BA12676|nr:hypothetical protein [Marinococcus halophilus]OZT78719.1 hypothetical protein CHL76_16530 [Marinococcus halophilus]